VRIAFVSIPAAGHVNPTLPLVAELVRRGHSVTYATSDKFSRAVESVGATFLPSGEDLATVLPTTGTEKSGPGQMARMMMPMMVNMVDGARAAFPGLVSSLRESGVDAICYDSMTFTGAMAAEKLALPDIALYPTYANNEHFSLRDLMPTEPPQELLDTLQWLKQATDDFAAEQQVSPASFMDSAPASLNVVFIPREFQPAGDTFDDRFHFVGPSLGERAADERWTPSETKKPLLFISLGTTPLNNRPDFFQLCVEAFGDGDWDVAMAIGEQTDPAELGQIPENFDVRPFFPQLDVLRHADVFLSHAGMNSTMESLYLAVPMVTAPQQPEQEANARRVEELGLGRPLNTAELSPEHLRDIVAEVGTDQQIRGNLTAMSTVVRDAGGAVAAADAIETHLANLHAGTTAA